MANGHFNVIKGAYPSLSQLDKALPVTGTSGALASSIVRGSTLRIVSNAFQITKDDVASHGAAGTPGPIVYWALQDYNAGDVLMSGKLNALPCVFPAEVETDQWDTSGTAPTVGCYLMAGAGVVKVHTTGCTAIGVCTSAPTYRWSNDAIRVPGQSTGNRRSCVKFWTIYQPELAI